MDPDHLTVVRVHGIGRFMAGCAAMGDRVYRAANLLGRGLIRALDIGVHPTGAEHLPASGPVLLACNHVSFPDFVFVEKAAVTRGRFVRFMCRHDIWHQRQVAWFMDRMRHIPVDRAAPAGAYVTARALLRQGEAVGSFPEAGISHSFTVRSLMPGAAALAAETGAPVVPVAIWGSQRIWSVSEGQMGRLDLTRGRRVDVAFGEPLYVGARDDVVAAITELGHRLTGMLEDLQQRPHHRPGPGEHAPWHPAHLGGHAPDRVAARGADVVPRNAVAPTWGPLAHG